jgi:hypothetical protein
MISGMRLYKRALSYGAIRGDTLADQPKPAP